MSLRFKLSIAVVVAIAVNLIALASLKHQIIVLNEHVSAQELKSMELELLLTTIDNNIEAIDEHLTEQYIDSTIIKYCKTTLFLDYLQERRNEYYQQNADNPDVLLPDKNNHGSISAINRIYEHYDQQRTQMMSILHQVNMDVPSQSQCNLISQHLL